MIRTSAKDTPSARPLCARASTFIPSTTCFCVRRIRKSISRALCTPPTLPLLRWPRCVSLPSASGCWRPSYVPGLEGGAHAKLRDVGFSGGRDNFRDFCARIFASDEPRFLRTEHDHLVVFRHADLRAFGSAPQVGNVPPAILYPGRFRQTPGCDRTPGSIGAGHRQSGVHRQPADSWTDAKDPDQLARPQARRSDGGPRARNAQAIIDTVNDGDEIDFVSEFAETLTTNFWAALLHLTDKGNRRHSQLRPRNDAALPAHPDSKRIWQALDRAFAEYAQPPQPGGGARASAENDPLITDIAAQLAALNFADDPLRAGIVPKSVGDFLAGNLVDGFHTAALASANTIYVLARHPEA